MHILDRARLTSNLELKRDWGKKYEPVLHKKKRVIWVSSKLCDYLTPLVSTSLLGSDIIHNVFPFAVATKFTVPPIPYQATRVFE